MPKTGAFWNAALLANVTDPAAVAANFPEHPEKDGWADRHREKAEIETVTKHGFDTGQEHVQSRRPEDMVTDMQKSAHEHLYYRLHNILTAFRSTFLI